MIRRLIILLLIVGCAPTKPPTATFHIGMKESEFLDNNPNILKSPKDVTFGSYKVSVYYEESSSKITTYYYGFNGDTLRSVWHGAANVVKNKQIDYSKYPGSKPE